MSRKAYTKLNAVVRSHLKSRKIVACSERVLILIPASAQDNKIQENNFSSEHKVKEEVRFFFNFLLF